MKYARLGPQRRKGFAAIQPLGDRRDRRQWRLAHVIKIDEMHLRTCGRQKAPRRQQISVTTNPIFEPIVAALRVRAERSTGQGGKGEGLKAGAEFEMPDVFHIVARKGVISVDFHETAMLAQQRAGLVYRVAEWNEADGIRKDGCKKRQPRDIAVVLREIAGSRRRRRQRRQLSKMTEEEFLELRVAVGRAPEIDVVAVIFAGPERLSQYLFESLGTVIADGFAVAMGALALDSLTAEAARN